MACPARRRFPGLPGASLALALAAVLVAGCGDDDQEASYDKPAYCSAAQALSVPVSGTAASTGTLDERLAEISSRATAWRALRALAPERLADEHALVADAQVSQVQALADIRPATIDDLNLATGTVARMLDERFPDRGAALDAVNQFTQAECGLAVTEG